MSSLGCARPSLRLKRGVILLRAGSHPHQAGILSHHLHLSQIKEILQPLNLQSLQSFPVKVDVNFQTLHSQQLTPTFTFTPVSVTERIRAGKNQKNFNNLILIFYPSRVYERRDVHEKL